ncbi:hypothetical protein [Mycobacterium sp. M26]|uniref:hypothetical protein n=1 Tax=Mycobacterium sp. M26 TaxID=1762962 RepID=UPI00073EA2D3|nr:hypothetical protein [Mycobacterium sp. M26]
MASEVNSKGAAAPVSPSDEAVSEVMAQLAEAEAAEAQARAEAAKAKAAAARLRGEADEPEADEPEADEPEAEAEPRRRFRLLWRVIAAAVLVVGIGALLTVSGLMIWQHQRVEAQRAHRAQMVDAAKTGVTALLSIDYTRAKADVQKVIDLSTGTFKDDFTKGAEDFVKTAEQSKAVTVGSISAAALESDNGDSGVVLLAASSQVTNANGAKQDPRAWRMSVTVTRDGDKLKMSNVEFVP